MTVGDALTGHGALAIPLQLTRGCIVASVQVELSSSVMARFQDELLSYIKKTGATSVIVDLSGVGLMDRHEFETIRAVLNMVSVMGARPMLAGIRPEVVSALIDLGSNVDGVEAAFDLDDALDRLQTDPSIEADNLAAPGSINGDEGEGGADADETDSLPYLDRS